MTDTKPKNDCAIIVSSCDKYSDAWLPFFTLFFKYWPDCPFPIYLLSGTKVYPDERVRTLTFGSEKPWAEFWKKALAENPYDYILYIQDDYFIKKPVSTEKILHLLKIMKEEDIAYLRLYPSPGPDKKFKNYTELGEISKDSEYRMSIQAALWKREIFEELIIVGEWSADFETANRSSKLPGTFLCVKRGIFFPYDNSATIDYLFTGILKGRWHRGIISLFRKEKITADLSRRPIEPYANYIQHILTFLPFVGRIFRQIYRIKYKIIKMYLKNQ